MKRMDQVELGALIAELGGAETLVTCGVLQAGSICILTLNIERRLVYYGPFASLEHALDAVPECLALEAQRYSN